MDAWAGIGPRMLSEHTRRVVSLAGSTWPFDEASSKLKELCHLGISDDTIERVCQEEGDRCGRWVQEDQATADLVQSASGEMEFSTDGVKINTTKGWSEMRLSILAKRPAGASAEPEQWDDRVLPDTTARLAWGAIAPCRLVGAGWKRMFKHLEVKKDTHLSVMADGAKWIWDQAAQRLPSVNAQWVVDIYHVSQHIHDCGKALLGEGPAARQWADERRMELIKTGGPGFIRQLEGLIVSAASEPDRHALERLRNYLGSNADSLWYRKRLKEGRSIGSGMMEGGCKTIVAQRLKRNNARWRPRRAEKILNLRCLQYSDCWDAYWNQRAA